VLQADQRRRVRNWEAIRKVVNDLGRCKTDAATREQNDPKLPRIYTAATLDQRSNQQARQMRWSGSKDCTLRPTPSDNE
jgi:hypothetical protein